MSRRKALWNHNGLFGSAGMIHANLRRIRNAETATMQTKAIADTMLSLNEELKESLKRRNQQSEAKELKDE